MVMRYNLILLCLHLIHKCSIARRDRIIFNNSCYTTISLVFDISWTRPKFNIMILFYLSIIPTERTVSNQLNFLISDDAFEYKLALGFPWRRLRDK